jgi:signal transduction histidine kinase
VSPSEHTPRTARPAVPSRPPLSTTQLEANLAHELNNLLNVVSVCGDRLAHSPDVTAAARLDLLALAGRVAHAIIDGRRRGVSLRRWVRVNPTLHNLEGAVRLLLSPAIDVALELDPEAGSVHLAPGELDLVILNLVLDARSRLAGSGRLAIRSEVLPDAYAIAVTVSDRPREAAPARSLGTSTFGLETVRLIARDAGGEADLVPDPGGGSDVRIRLPARR